MTPAFIIEVLETLADIVSQLAPVVAQGAVILAETDAAQIHAALVKAEQATAALKSQVDVALSQAAQS